MSDIKQDEQPQERVYQQGFTPTLFSRGSTSSLAHGMKPPIQAGGMFRDGNVSIGAAVGNENPMRQKFFDMKQAEYQAKVAYQMQNGLSLAAGGRFRNIDRGQNDYGFDASVNYSF